MCLSVNLNLWQVIVGTLVVLRDHRLSEEVVSQAVEVHFKRFHIIAEAVCEDTFLKWTSKMGHAIVLMAMKFKRLFTVSSTSKSAKLSQMKKALAERLAARSGSSDSLDMDKSLPDPLPLLEEVKPAESLEVLGQMLAESAKRAKAAASDDGGRASSASTSESANKAQEALQKLALPAEAGAPWLHATSELKVFRYFSLP